MSGSQLPNSRSALSERASFVADLCREFPSGVLCTDGEIVSELREAGGFNFREDPPPTWMLDARSAGTWVSEARHG